MEKSLTAAVQVLYNNNPLAMAMGPQPGDTYRGVHLFRWEVANDPESISRAAQDAAAHAFDVLNTNHPEGWVDRSMSVGDIVILGEVAVGVAAVGFVSVDISQVVIVDDASARTVPTVADFGPGDEVTF